MPLTKLHPEMTQKAYNGFLNRIINGHMRVAQRGTSFAAAANGSYPVDRFVYNYSSTAVATAGQVADAPANSEFDSCVSVAITTADASIANSEYSLLGHKIEGYHVRDLIGRDFTLSFWVRSSVTGTYATTFRNSVSDLTLAKTYAINTANTWEKKSVTVAGGLPSSGTWDFTNGIGLTVGFALACGSDFQTTPDAWNSGNFISVAGQANALGTNGNIFRLTGVQLEVGSAATTFEQRAYPTELALCQRYFTKLGGASTAHDIACGVFTSTTNFRFVATLPVTMRTNPTPTLSGAASSFTAIGGSALAGSALAAGTSSPNSVTMDLTVAGATLGQGGFVRDTSTSAWIACTAEL